MQKNKVIITLGVVVALLPILGFPRDWESFFQVAIGVALILISIWSNIDKKLTLRAKAERRQAERRRRAEDLAQTTEVPVTQDAEITE